MPSRIIELRGGTRYTHRPPRAQEPQPAEGLPRCPRYLDALARKHWRYIGNRLLAVRVITELDLPVLAVHCQAYSEWIRATVETAKGMVYARKDKSPVLNPYIRIARDAADRIMRTSAELGLGPASRTRIKVEKPKSLGKVESFMGRKRGNGHG